jgi:hypothetical protein
VFLGCVLLVAGASGARDAIHPGPHERLVVESFYLCDGYESFGDATFYDCARRFFRDGARPSDAERMTGTWVCRTSFNGPSENWEQRIYVGWYRKKATRKAPAEDRLLVTSLGGDLRPKEMYRRLHRPSVEEGAVIESLVGEIVRSDAGWSSTHWGYGRMPMPYDFMYGMVRIYDQRASFRVYDGNLVVEHVVREPEKERLIQLMNRSVGSDPPTRAASQPPTTKDISGTVNRLVEKYMYEGRNPYRPNWTERSLREARPVALYDEDWNLPIMYSECRRPDQW